MIYVLGRKPEHETLFFRVKWLQATMKGTSCVRRVRLRSIRTRLVPSMCFATSGCSCGVVLCVSWSCGCRSHCNGCMNVAWSMFWGGSRSTKPCVFPCKVAAGDDERYLVCATGAAAVVPDAIGSFYVFCNKWLFLWCSSMRFLKLWLQIIGMAAWLLSFGVATSVDRCRFATGCCETHCSGCVKVARCCGCMRNTIVFCSWRS